jgi:hypothetical protein
MKVISCILVLVLIFGVTAHAQSDSLVGVWQIMESGFEGPSGGIWKATQPSLYIFTKKHYSVMVVLGDTPRPELSERSAATPEQIKEVDRFTANGGTYELKDGKLTLRPLIAKAPSFMKSGNYTVSKIELNGKTLTIKTVSNQSGTLPVVVVNKLVRVE